MNSAVAGSTCVVYVGGTGSSSTFDEAWAKAEAADEAKARAKQQQLINGGADAGAAPNGLRVKVEENNNNNRSGASSPARHEDAEQQKKRSIMFRDAARAFATPPLLKVDTRPTLHRLARGSDACCLSRVCLAPGKAALGLFLTAILLIIAVIAAPVVLFVRILRYIHTKLRSRGRTSSLGAQLVENDSHCDVFWPLAGHARSRVVLTLSSEPDTAHLSAQLNRLLSRRDPSSLSPVSEGSGASVSIWDQQKARIRVVRELLNFLNRLGEETFESGQRAACEVILLPNFANVDEKAPSSCCVAIVSLESGRRRRGATGAVRASPSSRCLPRLLTTLSDGRLVFEIEPRLSRAFLTTTGLLSTSSSISTATSLTTSSINVPLALCNGLYHSMQFAIWGPLAVLSLALKPANPVWRLLMLAERPSRGKRKWSPSRGEDGAILMEEGRASSGDDEERQKTKKKKPKRKDENGNSPGSKSLAEDEEQRNVCWLRIAGLEQIARAERLLRASTMELLLSFVAGALRAHFREQGIKHPPDVAGCVPVSCRELSPVEAQRACEAVLLPIRIPTSVEGGIPRIWAAQRRLSEALDGVLPNALKIAHSEMNRKLSETFYDENTVLVTLMRSGGELLFDGGSRVQSALLFPSLPKSVTAAFCFVQVGGELLLSASLKSSLFPDAEKLLGMFKTEIWGLVEQLSMRLLTLSQTTFLPTTPPLPGTPAASTARSFSEMLEAGQMEDEEVIVNDKARITTSPTQRKKMSTASGHAYTLEELQKLLMDVQAELDGMRANPGGDRVEYIAKLTELEGRMQAFHSSITAQLGEAAFDECVQADATLAANAVAELLAPYRHEPAIGARRFSREFLRTDNPPRKASFNG